MPRKNHAGTLSLLAAMGGFATLEGLRAARLLPAAPGWTILQSGFEAGMVGGLADWFAVSALFRPIPSRRFRIPHTNLLVEQRATLSRGIVDMVQNRWLGPETLAEHLDRLSASRFLLEHLSRPEAWDPMLEAARDLLGRLAGSLDAPGIAGFLDRALRDQLAGMDLGPVLGPWLEARIRSRDTAALWEFLAGTLARAAEQGDFDAAIRAMLEAAAAGYKDRGPWERLKASVGELFFDYGRLTGSIAAAVAGSLRGIQSDPDHPVRAHLDQRLLEFAQDLARGDREASAVLERLQRRLGGHADLGPVLARVLGRLQETLKAGLSAPGSAVSRALENLLGNLLRELRSEPAAQARLDAWVRRTVLDLAQRNHGIIGDMVAGSLGKLSDDDLVAQIEEKIGADLQYIRLNGAVVGGLVGVLLQCAKLAIR